MSTIWQHPGRQPRVKICCISSAQEAQLAIEHGADALGLVADMPSGPGIIEDALIREIAASIPDHIATFLLTSRDEVDDIIAHAQYCQTNTLQLVRHIEPTHYARLRSALPHTKLVQVIHVQDHDAVEIAATYAPLADALLLDSGTPNVAAETLGGTGNTHDWQISAQIVRASDKPVFLAGGLKPHNVGDALSTVAPFGLDLCSGVRRNGQLDPTLLREFMQAANR